VAVADEIAGEFELLLKGGILRWQIVPYGLQLETDTREALCKSVVHLVRQPLAFLEDGAKAPILNALKQEPGYEREEKQTK
jgi:hypothetical protein